MDDGKGQTIFLTVIGIATLLVAIVGSTFAWFSITVSGNEKTNDVVITKSSLGQVSFNDGTKIEINDIKPGEFVTKTFSVSQTDPSSSEKISYNIVLNVKTNSFSKDTNIGFIQSLKSTGNSNGGKIVAFESASVPEQSKIIGSGIIDGYEIHNYEYSIGIDKTTTSSLLQGKSFSGYLSVVLTGGE